jgi:hypothetical protein
MPCEIPTSFSPECLDPSHWQNEFGEAADMHINALFTGFPFVWCMALHCGLGQIDTARQKGRGL